MTQINSLYIRPWRLALRIRFVLFQQHRHRHRVIETINNTSFIVLSDVFNPALFFSSKLLIQAMIPRLKPDQHILDLGSGSGVVGILASKAGTLVTAVDINPTAVTCTRMNARLHGVEYHMSIMQSNIFQVIEDCRYDLILFNPPYYKAPVHNDYDHAWNTSDMIIQFAAQLKDHLTVTGYALVVVSTNAHYDFETIFLNHALKFEVVLQRRIPSETLTVYAIQPGQSR